MSTGLPRIFIGGTGRSGTTILYNVLRCQEEIHALPHEMRFLIDPDGLIDLVDALTDSYSPVRAREAVYRFERLMRVYLTVPDRAPYQSFDFHGLFGREHYEAKLDEFLARLVEGGYEGTDWVVKPQEEGRLVAWAKRLQSVGQRLRGRQAIPARVDLRRDRLALVRYFADRSRLVVAVAEFVDELFLSAAARHGKETWCEKTPHNFLHLGFLQELFPHSVAVHVKRDPRGVVQSLCKQFWAPSDLEGACSYLRSIYERWFDERGRADLSPERFLEIKLEDFADSPEDSLRRVTTLCGVAHRFQDPPEISAQKVNYWRDTLGADDRRRIEELLGDWIERMGYEVS